MNLKGKRILVTGADGFIGSHLVEKLVAQGCDVRAFVFYNSMGSLGWLDSCDPQILSYLNVFSGDIRDPNGVRAAMRGCDVVLHLAALIGIPYSYHSPDSYVDTNIKGTLNVLQAARDLDVQRIVHTSTSEVYGTAQRVPIDEEHPLRAQSPYAATKLGADQLALSFQRSFDTPVIVLRPFNTYGPRQSLRAFIPTVISQISSGNSQVRLGALNPTRDFSFVSDTASAFIAIASCDAAVGEVVNSGSGFEISMEDTARLIAELMKAEIEIVEDSQRFRPIKSEVERLFASTDKARRLMQWEPEYGGLVGFRRGLEETVSWFKSASNRSCYETSVYRI